MRQANMQRISSLNELKNFIYQTLCRDHDLLINSFPTSESVLRRGQGAVCGIMFCLHGPRAAKFTAIWERDNNRILFYGPNGKRYGETSIPETERFEMPELSSV
ncbi:MAG: hypothetical protein LBU65_16725 [Planctomycetaceae bacterium]|jgi:hypothetical protein|nr:hypothetical protein [Planctomycetaceae bacterium]